MDRGAWQATVHRVAKSWTQLSNFTFTFASFFKKEVKMINILCTTAVENKKY